MSHVLSCSSGGDKSNCFINIYKVQHQHRQEPQQKHPPNHLKDPPGYRCLDSAMQHWWPGITLPPPQPQPHPTPTTNQPRTNTTSTQGNPRRKGKGPPTAAASRQQGGPPEGGFRSRCGRTGNIIPSPPPAASDAAGRIGTSEVNEKRTTSDQATSD